MPANPGISTALRLKFYYADGITAFYFPGVEQYSVRLYSKDDNTVVVDTQPITPNSAPVAGFVSIDAGTVLFLRGTGDERLQSGQTRRIRVLMGVQAVVNVSNDAIDVVISDATIIPAAEAQGGNGTFSYVKVTLATQVAPSTQFTITDSVLETGVASAKVFGIRSGIQDPDPVYAPFMTSGDNDLVFSGTTNASGVYTYTGRIPQNTDLYITKNTYVPRKISGVVFNQDNLEFFLNRDQQVLIADPTKIVTVSVRKQVGTSGLVLLTQMDELGLVWLTSTDSTAILSGPVSITSQASLPAQTASYRVWYSSPTHVAVSGYDPVTINTANTTSTEIRAQSRTTTGGGAQTLTVEFQDAITGAAAQGVRCWLTSDASGQTLVSSVLEAGNGTVAFGGLTNGTYYIWFSSEGYLGSNDLQVVSGDNPTKTIHLTASAQVSSTTVGNIKIQTSNAANVICWIIDNASESNDNTYRVIGPFTPIHMASGTAEYVVSLTAPYYEARYYRISPAGVKTVNASAGTLIIDPGD